MLAYIQYFHVYTENLVNSGEFFPSRPSVGSALVYNSYYKYDIFILQKHITVEFNRIKYYSV